MFEGLETFIYIAAEGTQSPGKGAFGAIILAPTRPPKYLRARFRRTTLDRAALLGAVETTESQIHSYVSIVIRTDCSFLANSFRYGIPVRSSRRVETEYVWRPNQDLVRRIAEACARKEMRTVQAPQGYRLILKAHDLAKRALEDRPATDDPQYPR